MTIIRLQSIGFLPVGYLHPVISRVRNIGEFGLNVDAQRYHTLGLAQVRTADQLFTSVEKVDWSASTVEERPGETSADHQRCYHGLVAASSQLAVARWIVWSGAEFVIAVQTESALADEDPTPPLISPRSHLIRPFNDRSHRRFISLVSAEAATFQERLESSAAASYRYPRAVAARSSTTRCRAAVASSQSHA
jgi:hypothetical protein